MLQSHTRAYACTLWLLVNFRCVLHSGFHELHLSDLSRHTIYPWDIIQILGAQIAEAKGFDMSINVRIKWQRKFWVDSGGQSAWDSSRHPRTGYYIDLTVIDCWSQEAWKVHLIEINSSRDNSELILEAYQLRDRSEANSVDVHCNK